MQQQRKHEMQEWIIRENTGIRKEIDGGKGRKKIENAVTELPN